MAMKIVAITGILLFCVLLLVGCEGRENAIRDTLTQRDLMGVHSVVRLGIPQGFAKPSGGVIVEQTAKNLTFSWRRSDGSESFSSIDPNNVKVIRGDGGGVTVEFIFDIPALADAGRLDYDMTGYIPSAKEEQVLALADNVVLTYGK